MRLQNKTHSQIGVLIVARPGFEPRQTESESVVLPLYYQAIVNQDREIITFLLNTKFLTTFYCSLCKKDAVIAWRPGIYTPLNYHFSLFPYSCKCKRICKTLQSIPSNYAVNNRHVSPASRSRLCLLYLCPSPEPIVIGRCGSNGCDENGGV